MSSIAEKTMLGQIVNNLNLLDNLPIDMPVTDIMANIDTIVNALFIDNGKAVVNWTGVQHNQINFHVFKQDDSNTMVVYHAIIRPGFLKYEISVDYHNSFGSGYPATDWRRNQCEIIESELRQALG